MTPRARAVASGLAVLSLAVGGGLWQYTKAKPKPVVEARRIADGAPRPVQPIGLTAHQALERRADLRLTEAQVGRLMELDREWQGAIGPLEGAVREAEVEFQRFMDEAVRSGRASLPEIQRRAGPTSCKRPMARRRCGLTWRSAAARMPRCR